MRWTVAALALAACGREALSPSDGQDGSAEGSDDDAGDDEDADDGTCIPGQQVECTCSDGSPSFQRCPFDGQAFEPCLCEGSDTTGGPVVCLSADEPFPGTAEIDSDDDIAEFAQYSVIAGSLKIEGPGVTSLVGFECLQLIGNQIYLADTTLLTDFTGLENVQVIRGEMEIGHNAALASFVGLSSLTTLGYMSLYDNSSLASFIGLDSLTTIEEGFGADRNDDLATCTIVEFLASLDTVPATACYRDNLEDACIEQCG